MQRTGVRWTFVAVVCGALTAGAVAQGSARDVVNAMLAQEHDAAMHRDSYIYLSNERSDRTGGHLWTERVAETPMGRVRLLLQEDGKPISTDRMQQEHSRLANDAAHPEGFQKREAAQKNDESHARETLNLLPKGFILENMKEQTGDWRIDFRPDPKFSPSGMEQHVVHGMSGWMLIDQRKMRLHHIEGRLTQDLNLDLGLLSVKSGSNFETTKMPYDGQWRTIRAISDIRGKAALLKTISRNQDVARTEFKRVDNHLSVADAVALVER